MWDWTNETEGPECHVEISQQFGCQVCSTFKSFYFIFNIMTNTSKGLVPRFRDDIMF